MRPGHKIKASTTSRDRENDPRQGIAALDCRQLKKQRIQQEQRAELKPPSVLPGS